jgi:nucleotide-binding universal stress UspA family protein
MPPASRLTQSQRPPHIVVGVDGSEASRSALRWALAEAELRRGEVEAVIAWRPALALAAPAARPAASGRSLEEQGKDAKARIEHVLAGEETAADVEVRCRATRGTANRVLLEASSNADLLVIGGRSGQLTGKLPWSTGRQLVGDAHCPVVVVPPPSG